MYNNIPITTAKVLAIESFNAPPYKKGQQVGLLVKEGTIMHRGDIIRIKPQQVKE